MWQKPQERVQTSPRIMSVAVPADQHSPMLGHLADWQTVWRFCSRTSFTRREYSSPPGMRILSQDGLRAGEAGSMERDSVITTERRIVSAGKGPIKARGDKMRGDEDRKHRNCQPILPSGAGGV